MNAKPRKKAIRILIAALAAVAVAAAAVLGYYFNVFPQSACTMEDLGVARISSPVDRNLNGIDDYADLLAGARQDAQNRPRYDGRYFDGGYPPEDVGVCTDTIWRAFRQAGYSLRDMVDRDIAAFPDDYPSIAVRDANIDFRRVENLQIFFEKYAVSLTTDLSDAESWQPGDIVIFNNGNHIGIVSDLRAPSGRPYIIHNAGQPRREEDYLKRAKVYAHYRFDASLIPESALLSWQE